MNSAYIPVHEIEQTELDSSVPHLNLKHGVIQSDEFEKINARLPKSMKNYRKQMVGELIRCL